MNKPFIEIDAEHFTLSAFETKPIEGYEAPTNKETGEQFPNCCPFHKSVFEGAESWFLKFPNCCDQHKAMVSKWWYNKANYSGIAEKIVKQLSYTEHHISERINIDDWYKDITDYIEYNVSSFGHPAIGLHLYLGNVKHYIKNTNSEIPKIKRQVLIEFIETYYNSPIDIDKTNKTDLNVLYSTYQKWLKVFPFEISFFSTLKPHFEKQLPILNGKPETNKYTGIAKAKMHTKGSLIDVLLNLTNNLLTQINTTTLYEKGLLTEPQKIKLELVLNERKMKLKQGYVNNSKDEEQRYRKILKEWFADEKRFIDEVTPIIKALPPQPIIKQKPELNGKLITFKNSETIDKIHSELKGYFPNKEAELLKALQGEQLGEILLFPHNQNKFVEVFRRLKYNGFLLNTDTETKNWICTTFQFVKKGFAEPQPFNESSVWDNLNKGKGEPTKKERICITDWLPYKSPLQLTRETENEKL
jgi:hypothetical protein